MARSTTTTVKPRRSGIGDLLNSREVRNDLEGRGQVVLQSAKSQAPVETGAYRDSIALRVTTTDRVVVQVVATVPYAVYVESDRGVLVRALSAAGGSTL